VYILQVVGEGAYGRVMMARDTETAEGRPVAIKEFKVSDDDPDAEEVRRTSRREVALLKVLNHPHIVKYLNEFYDQENKLFVVMEFVPRNLLEVKFVPPLLAPGPWPLAVRKVPTV
jgi:serine/threonine protein kinase